MLAGQIFPCVRGTDDWLCILDHKASSSSRGGLTFLAYGKEAFYLGAIALLVLDPIQSLRAQQVIRNGFFRIPASGTSSKRAISILISV